MKTLLHKLLFITALMMPWAMQAQPPCLTHEISTLPYFNDFENEPHYPNGTSYLNAFPSCWTRINDAIGSSNYFPYVAYNNFCNIHGSNCLYWRLEPGVYYANNEYAVLPPVGPGVHDSLRNLTLAFYAKTSATEAPWPMLIVGMMHQSNDTSSFVPVDTITLTPTAELYAVNFANYPGTDKYIAIRSPRTTETRHASLDDIYLNLTILWCNPPSNLNASATNSSVTLSWNGNGNSSFTVILGSDTVTGVTDTFYTFQGLTDSTLYDYAVCAECPRSNSFFMRGSIMTECHTLTYDDLPYTEDFESYEYGREAAFTPCWHRGMTGTGVNQVPFPERCLIDNDTVGLYFSTSTEYSSWAILPRLSDSVDVSSLEVEFLVMRTYQATNLTQLVVGVCDSLQSTTYGLQYVGFVPVDTIDLSNERINSLHPLSVRFETYVGNGKYILFLAPQVQDSVAQYIYNTFHLDNVTLKVANPCPTPQNVRVVHTNAFSVSARWDAVPTADTFLVYVGAPGSATGSATLHYANSNSITINGLTPDTDYELVVVAYCNGRSDASYPVTFHTLCAPIDMLPFTEDFEDTPGITYPSAMVNNLPRCWLYWNMDNESQYRGFPVVYTNTSGAHSGTNAMMFRRYDSDQIALLPLTDATLYPLSSLQVSFWLHAVSNSSYQLVVGVMSDPTDTSTFVPIRTIYPTSMSYVNWIHYAVGFANYEGPHGHIAFKAPLPAWGGNQFYIDDITLDERSNNCPPIEAIHSETSASAARLTWDYNTEFGTPTRFNVRYCYANDTLGDTTELVTTEPELVITGLGADSAYWVMVEADCDGSTGIADTIVFSTQGLPCVDWDTVNTLGDTLVLGNPGTGTNAYFPVNATAPYSYVQHLFLASEIPVSGPTTLKGIGFDYAFSQPAYHATNCTISLAHTTSNNMSGGFVGGQQQVVYTGSLGINEDGWNYVLFNQGLFEYDGVSNLCVSIEKNGGVTVNSNFTFRHETTVDYNMTCWGYRLHSVGNYTISPIGNNMRSNTRLITSGDVYCDRWATCLPPNVWIDTTAQGDYRLSWLPGYREESWDVDYRIADTGAWTQFMTGTTDINCTIPMANLEWDTRYEFRVTANCSDTNLSTSVFVVTPCSTISIPFTYGFEGLPTGSLSSPTEIHCWHHLNDGATSFNGFPYAVGSHFAHTGDRAMAWAISNNTNHGSYQALVLPPVDVAVNSLYLSFWAKRDQYSPAPVFLVGVMTDPENIATFQTVDTIYVDSIGTDWDLYEACLARYYGDGSYIAILIDRITSGICGCYMDDLRVSDAPMCHRVNNIIVSNVTTDSATISWTNGDSRSGEWEISVGTATYITSDTVYHLHDVVSNTPYTVTVRAICGEGDTSVACSTSFRTPCYLLDSLPYLNDFENEPFNSSTVGVGVTRPNAFPVCWMRLPYNGNYYPYVVSNNNTVHGNNSLYWQTGYDNYPDYEYAVLPPVNLGVYNISDLYLSFYAKTTTHEAPYPMFVVGVMGNSTDTASFVPVDTIVPNTNTSLYIVSFAGYTGTGNYIAIRYPRTMQDRSAMLDDIFLTDRYCYPPSNLRSSSTDTSVTVWWSRNAGSSFTVILGADTITSVADTFYTFYSLNDSTDYNYAVTAECDGTNSVHLTGHIQTECPPLTYDDLPYREDFESYDSGYGASDISPCWHKGEIRDISNHTNRPHPSGCRIDNDTVALYFGSARNMSCWAALPRLDNSVDIATLEVNFLIRRPNVQCSSRLVVGVASDCYTDSANNLQFLGFTPVDTIDLSDQPSGSLHDISVRFANYRGNGHYILFHAPSPFDGSNAFDLDNVTLMLANPCPTPQNVSVSRVTYDSVYATWAYDPSAGLNADAFWVYIGAPGFDLGSVTPYFVYSNDAAIGGLTPDTDYEMVVLAHCSVFESQTSFHIFFHTLCAPLDTLPYVEDFEGVTGYTYPSSSVNNLPPCWLHLNTGSSYAYGGFPLVHADASYAHSGSNAMRFGTPDRYGSYQEQVAIMPLTDAVRLPVQGLQVSFWARSSDLNNNHIIVGVIGDPADTGSFIPVDTVATFNASVPTSTWYSFHTVSFSTYNGPHGHVAFKTELTDRPYIDDITLAKRLCATAEDFHLVYTGVDSLVVAWSDTASTESSWYIEYDTADFTPGTGTRMLVTDTFYTMTDLTPGSTYHIYLYPDCIDLDITAHHAYLSATTLELPPTCPSPRDVDGVVDADRLSLAWSPGGTENEWEVSLGASTVVVSTPSHTFTGLPFSIYYTVQLRAICGAGDTSLPVAVSFPNHRYRVTARANYPAFGSVTGGGMYYYGDMATLTATPNTGYNFTEWSDGIVANPRNLLVTGDTTLYATFTQIENINPLSTPNCNIYPNPAKTTAHDGRDEITVTVTGILGMVHIAVFDVFGREVAKVDTECPAACERHIDITDFASGTYLVRITSASNVPMVRKLIVR